MPLAAGSLISSVRKAAGLTQAELAGRLGVSQSTIAKLESPRSNPRLSTLERAVAATGNSLGLTTYPATCPGIDETLIESCLRRTPEQRLDDFTDAYRSMRQLAPTVRESG